MIETVPTVVVGVPGKPAANVARLLPGFEPSFSAIAFVAALAATLAWGWLVRWRTGRHRTVIWKSLVLPAGGAALCWLLVMTLWLPTLDFARSYAPVVRGIVQAMDRPGCVETYGLTRGQAAALRFHGQMDLQAASRTGRCPWLIAPADLQPAMAMELDMHQWRLVTRVRRPADRNDNVLLFRRAQAR